MRRFFRIHRRAIRLVLLAAVIGLGVYAVSLRETATNREYAFEQIAEGLNQPTYLTHAGDERLFIVEKPGRIRIIEDGMLLETPFLDLTDQVVDQHIEQGLFSIAFAPDYTDSGVFFVNYTAQPDNRTVVARLTVSDNPNVADVESLQIVLEIPQPAPDHNAGIWRPRSNRTRSARM